MSASVPVKELEILEKTTNKTQDEEITGHYRKNNRAKENTFIAVHEIVDTHFIGESNMLEHKQSHTNERPYLCEFCGATFKYQSNLKEHQRAVHSKPQKCNRCGIEFNRKSFLDQYIKFIHTSECLLKCLICEATFSDPQTLKKHERIHTAEKRFLCEVCGIPFDDRASRNAHRFIHSDKKPYECVTCGTGFMQRLLLYQHMQSQGHLNDTIIISKTMPTTDNDQIITQLTQMAPPGTIIGQIQTAPGTTSTTSQVAATQLQQIQPGTQQTIALSVPQQVPLPPTITTIKEEIGTNGNTESATTATSTQSDSAEDAAKENGVDGQSGNRETETGDTKPIVDGIETAPIIPSSLAIQPAPIPGTVPTQPTTNMPENGLPVAATAEEIKVAMVKPQVLMHVIEDFVIQESSEPFPVTRSSLLSDLKPTQSSTDKGQEISRKRRAGSPTSNLMGTSPKGELAKCDGCGTVDLRAKFKKNKRFCSIIRSKIQKGKPDEKRGKWKEEGYGDFAASGAESSSDPTSGTEAEDDKVNPLKWSVSEVCDFIRNLPGCSDYAEDFLIQEIDGQALMLLKEDHLMTAMAMKLGPALKIVAKIDDMRIDKEQPKQ